MHLGDDLDWIFTAMTKAKNLLDAYVGFVVELLSEIF